MSQQVEKMDKDEEASVLKRRRRELKTVLSELSDMLDWFQRHESQMTSNVIYKELDKVIVDLDEVIDDIQTEIDVLEGND
jgi:sugar-specific transcriptional regulator TrmB